MFDRLKAAASAGTAQRAAATGLLMAMSEITHEHSKTTAIHNAYLHLALSPHEEEAVKAWLQSWTTPHSRFTIEAAWHIEGFVTPYGLSQEDRQLLHTGLAAALAGRRFKLLGPAPGTAVPGHESVGRPEPLLEALAREDIAQALEYGLRSAPSSHWAIEAMLGAAFKSAQNRQPVGTELLHTIAEATAEDHAW